MAGEVDEFTRMLIRERDELITKHDALVDVLNEARDVIACLLDSYEATFGNVDDALAVRAIKLVPNWRERADDFDPTQD